MSIAFAVPDHPWVDSKDGASVRISMVVLQAGVSTGTCARVVREVARGDISEVDLFAQIGTIHADLTAGAAVASATPLRANRGVCQQGVKLVGPRDSDGFVIQTEDLSKFGGAGGVVKPYISNRELVQKPKRRYVIDFFGFDEKDARAAHPAAYQRLYDTVRPFREHNRDPQRRRAWWLFGRSNEKMRASVRGLRRFIVTPEVAKHRPFVFVSAPTIPDASLYVVGSDDAFLLGVLSSSVHVTWALAAGGHMGVGNDPRYQNGPCFDPFPFPDCSDECAQHIRGLAERIDSHRKHQQAAYSDLTITGIYNVLEKLRSGEPLTDKERVIHEQGLVSVLKQLHDDLDAAVFDAYGWPHDLTDEQILEKLVALNAERAEEERNGHVRWLRPEFQNPAGHKPAAQTAIAEAEEEGGEDEEAAPAAATSWPKKLADQITAVRELVLGRPAAWTATGVAGAFKGADPETVEDVLDSLAALGHLVGYEAGGERRWQAPRAVA